MSSPADTPASLAKLAASIPRAAPVALDGRLASRFAALSITCVDQEYPNKPSNIVDGDDTVKPPRELTPAFYGCFDWHSAVHGHWALVRLLKTFPDLPEAAVAREKLDRHLTAENLARELAYFKEPRNKTFERPYGWGWLLRLYAELLTFADADAQKWAKALEPLALHLADRSIAYLGRLSVPIRSGTHSNTAFAMVHMLDYARAKGDSDLAVALAGRAHDFYRGDVACPTAYEPSGEDFISPCLVEADLMRRVLAPDELQQWLTAFLPPLGSRRFAPMRAPVPVKDLKDPRIGHLIGLGFQRAWSFAGVGASLPEGDPRRPVLEALAHHHTRSALGQMFESGYGGEHWLASFAIYRLTSP